MSETVETQRGACVTVACGPTSLIRLEIVNGADVTNPKLAASALAYLSHDEIARLVKVLKSYLLPGTHCCTFNRDAGKGL